MALVQVKKSDKSGKEIPEGQGVRVRLMYDDADRVDRRADLTIKEAEELLPFAQEVETRPERRKRRIQI